MDTRTSSRLQLLAAAALFSTGGAAIKSIAMSSWEIAGYRSAIAALAFLVLVPASRRRWSARDVLVGAAYAATMVLFVCANKLTTSANAIFLQSTAPIYILLLAPWLLRERIRLRDVAFLAVVAAGLACFFVDEQRASTSATNPFLGNVLALCSGVGWASTVIGIRWLGARSEHDPDATAGAIVAGNVLAFLFCLAPILAAAGATADGVAGAADGPAVAAGVASGATSWLLLAYLGVFQIALAYRFVSAGMRNVEAFEASVLLLVEPVLNPVWSFLVHGERPGALSLAGGAVIVGATIVKTFADRGARARTSSRSADPAAPLAEASSPPGRRP